MCCFWRFELNGLHLRFEGGILNRVFTQSDVVTGLNGLLYVFTYFFSKSSVCENNIGTTCICNQSILYYTIRTYIFMYVNNMTVIIIIMKD
jgi:hypothetical protein